MGKSPKPGSLESIALILLRIRPAIAKVWPLFSSIVVSALRVVRAGTWKPRMVTEPTEVSSLTSGAAYNLIVPSPRTVGRNVRRTPNSLYSIVIEVLPAGTDRLEVPVSGTLRRRGNWLLRR